MVFPGVYHLRRSQSLLTLSLAVISYNFPSSNPIFSLYYDLPSTLNVQWDAINDYQKSCWMLSWILSYLSIHCSRLHHFPQHPASLISQQVDSHVSLCISSPSPLNPRYPLPPVSGNTSVQRPPRIQNSPPTPDLYSRSIFLMVHQASELRSSNVPSVLSCMSHGTQTRGQGAKRRDGQSKLEGKHHVLGSNRSGCKQKFVTYTVYAPRMAVHRIESYFLLYTMRATSYLERLLKTRREFPFGKDLALLILKNISSPSKSLLQISCPFLLKASLFTHSHQV